MSKVELDPIISGYNLSKINNNFQEIEEELNSKVLYRENPSGEPNHMSTTLDMSSNRIINLPDAISGSEPVTLDQLIAVDSGDSIELKADLAFSSGSSMVGFIQAGVGAVPRTAQAKMREIVSVTDFGATGDGITDDTNAIQLAVNHAISLAQSLTQGGSPAETTYLSSPFITIEFPSGNYKIAQADGVTIPANTYLANLAFESSSGANIIGNGTTAVNGTNKGFNFSGGARKNILKKLFFSHFGTAIVMNTSNANESMFHVQECQSLANDIFIDTVNYATSRSTMIHIKDSICGDTRVMVNHYADHMRIENTWMYAKKGSYDAMLRLSGDGIVAIDSCFFIPHGQQIANPVDSRFIDFVSESAQGSPADRSIKQLKISNSRMSLESARGFIWTYDTTGVTPNGNNQVSSIVIEDTYVGGTGGLPVVRYKQGYPGSVILRNCRPLASAHIVAADAGNTAKPIPSVPGALTFHVIEIDEATRLAQSNSNNSSALIDPQLEPFVYDTTSQTSKYKRSIRKNIDYRLRCLPAGSGFVKCTLPIYFDNQNAASNRDLLSFMVITVSDAGASPAAGRAIATSIVSLVALNQSLTDYKKLKVSTLSDAKGGVGETASAACTAHFGAGDTGSDSLLSSASGLGENEVTIKFAGTNPDVCWVYVIPLAGLRENQQDKMQFGVW